MDHAERQVLARTWRKRNPLTPWVGMQTGAAAVEDSMEAPQKVKNRSTLRSSNFTTGYLPPKYKSTNSKRYGHPYVYCNIIYSSQIMEAARVHRLMMDKDDVACVHVHTRARTRNEILFSHKKE